MKLRPYQETAKKKIRESLLAAAIGAVICVLPTGAGKTVIFSEVVKDQNDYVAVIAHRQELVVQMSVALNRDGVQHMIISPPDVVREACAAHIQDCGKSYYRANSKVAVIGVDTLLSDKSKRDLAKWFPKVKLVVIDEAHHVLRDNKWGAAYQLFPNAKLLGVTATPIRADGKGLGRQAAGFFDQLIDGPSGRDLIKMGYLTDYRLILSDPEGFTRSGIRRGKDGDFTKAGMKTAVRQSKMVGSVVDEYLKHGAGKQGITFAESIETAQEIADKFNAAGVPAAMVHGGTAKAERNRSIAAFRRGELRQLVNVDLFGEGFDVPSVEVVSLARPTESFSLFSQQVGRALRIMDGKEFAVIIDHVGNFDTHGLPEVRRIWDLGGRSASSSGQGRSDIIPIQRCKKCARSFSKLKNVCPDCGTPVEALSRTDPKLVDGDLTMLSPEALEQLRDAAEAAINPPMSVEDYASWSAHKAPPMAYKRNLENYRKKYDGLVANADARRCARDALREAIDAWGGYLLASGRNESEAYRHFSIRYGVDVLSAQTADAEVMAQLTYYLYDDMGRGIFDNAV